LGDLEGLFDQLKGFDRPPVETWNPTKTVDFDLRIEANGDWVHENQKITRHALVKLFSTVLVFRDGHYYLVTPPVKYRIVVLDAPFLAVELRVIGEGQNVKLVFRTNMDEVVIVDKAHPLVVETDAKSAEPNPYILVRDGLKARLTRSVFYQLADIALAQGAEDRTPGVTSDGCFFSLV